MADDEKQNDEPGTDAPPKKGPIYEGWKTIFMVAGLGFFALAFVSMGYLPWAHLSNLPMETMTEIAAEPSLDFKDLAERYPESFEQHYGEVSPESYAKALRTGRDVYIAEACWHCHSQQIRPVGGETRRFGPVSNVEEFQNELQLPHMMGTRRIGPDLIRVAGKYSNDWHVAHFWDPRVVVPSSVMPKYPWFFQRDKDGNPVPNERGLAMVAYIQWLGSWIPEEERLP
jgi:hypothetical protein